MKRRILIMDSERRWTKFASERLDQFDVTVAATPDEAFAQLDNDGYELVIASSRYMESLPTIRESYADKRVVVVTINPSVEEARDALKNGALRYFVKSFKPFDLVDRVNEVIRLKTVV